MTQYNLILNYLRNNLEWHYAYKFHGLETDEGFIGSSGERRIRELIKKGLVERRMLGKFMQVRFTLANRPMIATPFFDLKEAESKIDEALMLSDSEFEF